MNTEVSTNESLKIDKVFYLTEANFTRKWACYPPPLSFLSFIFLPFPKTKYCL